MKIKPWRVIALFLLMNDDEYTSALYVCVCGGKSQVFKACCCYKWVSLRFPLCWWVWTFELLTQGKFYQFLTRVFTLCRAECTGVCECIFVLCIRVCASNLLQWAVVNSHARSGTPWLWCACNEGFRCRSSPASRPSPSPRNYSKHTHSYTLITDLKYWNILNIGPKADFACVLCVWPDAVLVCHSDAGVEWVELHNRRYSRVAVDEYLIIQTGNTCNGVDKPE